MNIFPNIPGARYAIRNGITGAYIHVSLLQILTFSNRLDAMAYIKQHELNPEIYYVEIKKR